MSVEKLKHLNKGDKIYVEMVRQGEEHTGDVSLCFASGDNYDYIDDSYTFYTEEQIKEKYLPKVPDDGIVEVWAGQWVKKKVTEFKTYAITEGDKFPYSEWRIPEKKTTELTREQIAERLGIDVKDLIIKD